MVITRVSESLHLISYVCVTFAQATLLMLHTGWKTLLAPEGTVCSVVRVEVKGLQNNVRVRQIQVLGVPVRTLDSTLPAVIAQQKSCEGEALRVFRLLTSQVLMCMCVWGGGGGGGREKEERMKEIGIR